MSSSQTGASGAGGAPGSAGPSRNLTPRTGRFNDLSQAHSAITGRSGQGGATSSRSEAPAVEQQDEEEEEEEDSGGGGSPPLSLLIEPMREVSSFYGDEPQGPPVASPADSANISVGGIIDAYLPASVGEGSVASRSVSQHTGTLYKLDPEQARRDGAANHQLEEEEEEELPYYLQHMQPPRARLPDTPPAFRPAHGHRRANQSAPGPSPSSVANSMGLLASSSPPPVPAVPAAFVQAPIEGQRTTRELLAGSWSSLPGPDVGPSGPAPVSQERVSADDSRDTFFIGEHDQDDESSSHQDPFVLDQIFLPAQQERAVNARLRLAASTTFSQSPETSPAGPSQQQQQHDVGPSSRAPVSEDTTTEQGFSYGSLAAHTSTDRIIQHAAPHAGTSSHPSPPTLRTVAGAPPLFPAQHHIHRTNGRQVGWPSNTSRDLTQYGSSVASSSHNPRGRFPVRPTPPAPSFQFPSPSAGSAGSPFGRPVNEAGRRKYEFRDSIDEPPKPTIDRKGKGKEIASPYDNLDDDHEQIAPPQQMPQAYLRRPTVSTMPESSVVSEHSQFPFPLIPRDEAARRQAERHARGDFEQTIVVGSSNRVPSSSSRMPSDTPGAPLTSLIKAHQRKPVASTSYYQRQMTRQRERAMTELTQSTDRDDANDLGREAFPMSPLNRPYQNVNRPYQNPSSSGRQRMSSREIFNSFVNREGDLVTRNPGIRPSHDREAQIMAYRPGQQWDDIELDDMAPRSHNVATRLSDVVPRPDAAANAA